MELMFGGHLFKLRGIAPKKLKVLKEKGSIKLFKNVAQLCILQVKEIYDIFEEPA